jgi:hypothetical protein
VLPPPGRANRLTLGVGRCLDEVAVESHAEHDRAGVSLVEVVGVLDEAITVLPGSSGSSGASRIQWNAC